MQNGQDAESKLSARTVEPRERKIVLFLCLLAVVHVFVFSAGFPFFNNVDEPWHFDLVLKYSHGDLPSGAEAVSTDSAAYVVLMGSHAYMSTPADFPGGKFPQPPWTQSAGKTEQELETQSATWKLPENYEVSQAPLYYVLAGVWWDVGQCLGFHDGRLVYWLRFLNLVFIPVLVWLSYLAARLVFPQNPFLCLAPPALLAFMPQTAFYSIGNDMLTALCFGVTFMCLLKWLSSENPSAPLSAALGLAFGATYLSKMTTLPLLAVVAAAIAVKTWQSFRRGKLPTILPALMAFFYCAAPLILGWMMWCRTSFGDLTGSKLKIQSLGWTVKPFVEWWHHPIFTPAGFWTYLSRQLGTFWQGEFVWHRRPMALPGTDLTYAILSLMVIVLALPGLLANPDLGQRRALRLSLACMSAALGFFALLSIVYDFHNSFAPSRQYPYIDVGRMLLGMLIPFLLLFAYGFDRALHRFGNAAKFSILTTMILAMLISEIATDCRVFSNEYNWFHLP